MTLRAADCQVAYEALRSRGATFLTPPHDWGAEIRCFLRDQTAISWRSASQKPADSGMKVCPIAVILETSFGPRERLAGASRSAVV